MNWLFYVASCRLIFRHCFVGESKDLGNIRGTRISKVCLSPSAGVGMMLLLCGHWNLKLTDYFSIYFH